MSVELSPIKHECPESQSLSMPLTQKQIVMIANCLHDFYALLDHPNLFEGIADMWKRKENDVNIIFQSFINASLSLDAKHKAETPQ